MKNIEINKGLLSFYFFLYYKIYEKSELGQIPKKDLFLILIRTHSIPKEESRIIIKILERLDLIKKEGDYYKVKVPKKSFEEMNLEIKKDLGII